MDEPSVFGLQLGPWSAWVSGLLASVSLFLTVMILLRDRRRARQELASKFLCWYRYEWDWKANPTYPWKVKFFAHNSTDYVIAGATINYRFNPKAKAETGVSIDEDVYLQLGARLAHALNDGGAIWLKTKRGKRIDEFEPGARGAHEIRLPAEPSRYNIVAFFMDASGSRWLRELTGRRRLLEFVPKRGFRGWLARRWRWMKTR